MHRDREAWNRVQLFQPGRHHTGAPPPKLKKDRKKLEAAKAMEMPKTI